MTEQDYGWLKGRRVRIDEGCKLSSHDTGYQVMDTQEGVIKEVNYLPKEDLISINVASIIGLKLNREDVNSLKEKGQVLLIYNSLSTFITLTDKE